MLKVKNHKAHAAKYCNKLLEQICKHANPPRIEYGIN